MPQRIIREEIITSPRYWSVSDKAKILFYHLLLSVDDTARFSGNSFTIRAKCFPSIGLELDTLENLLDELSSQDMIRIYVVNKERFIFIPRFRQRIRYINSKYPAPSEEVSDILLTSDLSQTQDDRREEKLSQEERIDDKNMYSKNRIPIPENFNISDNVKQWATENKYSFLETHLLYFKSQAKAKKYSSDNWDEYFKTAIIQNWAKVDKNKVDISNRKPEWRV